MALTARDLKNDDTTDAGFDLALDSIAALSADVGVTKLMIGADGTNDGLISSAVPLPVDLGANNDVTLATLPDTAAGDLAAIVVDLAAIEVLLTAANVDHAANEVLLTSIDADTAAMVTDLAAIEVLLTAANVDHAANEVLLTTIAGDTTSIDGKITACDTDTVTISASLPAGTNAIGKLSANAGVDIGDVTDIPKTSGGLSMTHLISAATNNATNVKASAGQVYSVQAMNKNTNPRYVKLYNKASAPAPATDTGLLVKTLMLPGNTSGSGLTINWDKGLAFSTGISFAIVNGIADNDNTSVGAEDVTLNIDYK